jgi:metallothiol transferase
MAFTLHEDDFDPMLDRLQRYAVQVLPGRVRDERDRKSIYFLDPDGHRLEFHSGTLQDRLDYYKAEKDHMIFYEDMIPKKL